MHVLKHGYHVVFIRPKEVHNGAKPKSAPCTPCGNRDVIFDLDVSGNNLDHSAVTLTQVNCAASTPKLERAAITTHQHSLDCHRQRPAVVGCSPIEITSQLHRNHAVDVHHTAYDISGQPRRHRNRNRHRSATNR